MTTYPVYDPGRPGEVVLEAPASSPADVDAAVTAASRAAKGWAEVPLDERIALVVAAANAAVAAAETDDVARLLTRENGKVFVESTFEVATLGAVAQAFADVAPDALATRVTANGGEVSFEPFGVVAALLPFNWPTAVLLSKVAPALIAGNTLVVKPPPTCPGAALAVAAVMADALPAGVLTTVSGPGIEIGEQLIAHPGVAMVSLTGGNRTGRAVMQAAAARLVPVLLELGGNDAAIATPDVEPDTPLATRMLDAAFVTSGQVCMALKRLYVPAARLDQFVDALVEAGQTTVTGYGLDDDTTIGPLHTASAAARAEKMLAGCGAVAHRLGTVTQTGGNYVQPAIAVAPSPNADIVAEEQFAPILPVLPYDSLDDAVDAANASSYGLAASVWGHDAGQLDSLARRLQVGTVFRNSHGPIGLDPSQPFGGWKESGIGREYGPDGVLAYTRTRSFPPRGQLTS